MLPGNGAGNGSWKGWLLGLVSGGILAGTGALVKGVVSDGQHIAAHEIRIQAVEKAVEHIDARLDQLVERLTHK